LPAYVMNYLMTEYNRSKSGRWSRRVQLLALYDFSDCMNDVEVSRVGLPINQQRPVGVAPLCVFFTRNRSVNNKGCISGDQPLQRLGKRLAH